jgi:hypothetical protein
MNTTALSKDVSRADTITPAQRTLAKVVGALYLIQMATGVFGQVVVRDQLIIRGDATKTAQNIIAAQPMFRLSIIGDLITCTTVIVLIWALYVLLRPVNQRLALLAVLLRLAENAILCAATVNSLVVLKVLSGADYLRSFETPQLHSLVTLLLTAQGLAMNVGFVLLGFGSAVFAYVLMQSRYIPRWLAILGIFGSLLLSIVTLSIMVFPDLGAIGLSYMMPMGIYEVGLGLWLFVKGIQTPASALSSGAADPVSRLSDRSVQSQ